MTARSKDFDDYARRFPKDVQQILRSTRETIRDAAPQAEEVMSYGIPAFKMGSVLVWFAAYSAHIGFYPGASGIAAFGKQLSGYKSAKGSVQFPLDRPLPVALIADITKFRVEEQIAKLKEKAPKRS